MNDFTVSNQVKLPQNIQELVGEIGEKQVLLRLAIMVHQTRWGVFHNLGEAGYDILLMNSETSERIRIEVKARQKLYTTGTHYKQVQFFLTGGEYVACDFLVAYFLDIDGFYVVPKHDLKQDIVNDRARWRFTLSVDQHKVPHAGKEVYRDAWQTLHPDFQALKTKLGDF